MREAYDLLPESIAELFRGWSEERLRKVEEIRVRLNRKLEVVAGRETIYPLHGNVPYRVTKEDVRQLTNKLSRYSLYAFEEELKRGYVTISGGHRVGLAGKVITENGKVKRIRDICSFNIRIAKQKIGAADACLPYVNENGWLNTIIIGPPLTGKTTLLRDLARIISSGDARRLLRPAKIGIVDERSEIAGCLNGVPQHDLGERVDVLDACPKAEGMMMLIRSMSPEVIVVDEIGGAEDVAAVREAVNAGVKLMITAHAENWDSLRRRPSLEPLLASGVFERCIVLAHRAKPGVIDTILDGKGREVRRQQKVTVR
ncbi:MAG TPA: stage III sporulation protein AA [Bacillales bacterium]|nr:stage III sporulation protein AA [Bacillales bacterium]